MASSYVLYDDDVWWYSSVTIIASYESLIPRRDCNISRPLFLILPSFAIT